jgi:hypothetical protein
VRCEPNLSFNACAYFILITVSLVGYGSDATSVYSKGVVVVLIFIALFTLPSQFRDIEQIVNSRSQFKNAYKPSVSGENHIIVCGHVNNKQKLSAFLQEFLHPDRLFSNSVLFHVVVLHPCEPSAEVIEMITSFYFFQKVTFVVGSALAVDDLKRAQADEAFGMFFLCDTEVNSEVALQEDVCTVTRALSVSNFNPHLSCFVQVMQPGEREILQDSGVEVILCLDEYKTSLMAKNTICPGICTFVENLFHSFGGLSAVQEASLAPWHQEYIHGVHMEVYFVLLNPKFLKFFNYNFQMICDIFLIEYETIVVGVASENQTSVMFNPTSKDMKAEHDSWTDFFRTYNVAVVLADNNSDAERIGALINMPHAFEGMRDRVVATMLADSVGRSRSYVTKYTSRNIKTKSITKRRQSILNSGVKMVARGSSNLFRGGSDLFRSAGKKIGLSPSPLSRSGDDGGDEDNVMGEDPDSDFDSVEGDEVEYVGFTKMIRTQRQVQRHALTRSGQPRSRLPTREYIDTYKSLTPYRAKLISHGIGESKNPLALLKLGENLSTSVLAGQKLHANHREVDPAVRASARRKSTVTLKAVVGIVKMSRLAKASAAGTTTGDSPATSLFTTPKISPRGPEGAAAAGLCTKDGRRGTDDAICRENEKQAPTAGSESKFQCGNEGGGSGSAADSKLEAIKGPATLFLDNLKRKTASARIVSGSGGESATVASSSSALAEKRVSGAGMGTGETLTRVLPSSLLF